ncbi:hypothetical protein GCM10008024_30420 [Allgaiera indica]|uniref:Uncharacterized protein n=3 Tax=Allgaiera indica TaxID=765699 RepID=A0AAN5A0D3_9RHOB|nr:hypothetical protein GCM10008024_30420 [Allgaiera indica]
MREMQQFWHMLDQTLPSVQSCWDRKVEGIRPDRVEHVLEMGSSGERHMLFFFRDVWFGGGKRDQPFDVIEAIRVVDASQAHIIQEWLAAPFWP